MEPAAANACHRKKTQAEIIGKEEKEEQRRISSIKAEYEADMQKELHSQGRIPNVCKILPTNWLNWIKNFLSLRKTRHWSSNIRKINGIDRPYPRMATGTRRTETSAPAGTGNAESGNIFPARKNRPSEQRTGRSGRKCKGIAKELGSLQ